MNNAAATIGAVGTADPPLDSNITRAATPWAAHSSPMVATSCHVGSRHVRSNASATTRNPPPSAISLCHAPRSSRPFERASATSRASATARATSSAVVGWSPAGDGDERAVVDTSELRRQFLCTGVPRRDLDDLQTIRTAEVVRHRFTVSG